MLFEPIKPEITETTIFSKSNIIDFIAGLSIAGLLLPEAVAYSRLAHLSVQAGIVGLFAGLLAYGMFGKSRFAIVSATSSSAALFAASTGSIAGADGTLQLALSAGLVFVTALLFMLASVARMGSITEFIAKPVLRGFSFALAFVITIHQFGNIVEVKPEFVDAPRYVWALLKSGSEWNYFSLSVAIGAMFVMIGLSRYRFVPSGLIVITGSILVGRLFPEYFSHVPVVGQISVSSVSPSYPELSNNDWLRLLELAFAMVLIIYAESYGSIRNFALKHGEAISPNRDMFALGLANLISATFQGTAVGAGYSATSANEAAGAHSKRAGLFAALIILLIVLTLLPFIALTPEPVLAAIVINAVSHSLRFSPLKIYFDWKRDRMVLLAAIVSVLYLGVLNGFLVAIGFSVFATLKRFSQSTMTELGQYKNGHDYLDLTFSPEVKPLEGILILRPSEPLFFANIDKVVAEIQNRILHPKQPIKAVILSLEQTSTLDSTSLEALDGLIQSFENAEKILVLARLKGSALDVLTQIYSKTHLSYVKLTYASVSHSVKLAQKITPLLPSTYQ